MTNRKFLIFLTVVAVILGIATEVVVLWGQSQEATIRNEIATNAPLLKQAEAEKTAAEARKNEALAANAKIREKAEAKYKSENAIVETAIAKYAERMKRAEADKLQAEATAEQEIAKNAEVKLKAEAERLEIEDYKTTIDAALNQWIANCAASKGGGGGAAYFCSADLARALIELDSR